MKNHYFFFKRFCGKGVRCLTVTKIDLDKDNRMLRLGFGKNKGQWFIRLDLWFFGIRIS